MNTAAKNTTYEPPSGLQGPNSDFVFGEVILPTEIPTRNPHVIKLTVPIQLPERRIYCYIEVKGPGATDQYFFGAEIIALNHGTVVGRYPAAFGNIITTSTNQSLLSLVNSGGSAVHNRARRTSTAGRNKRLSDQPRKCDG